MTFTIEKLWKAYRDCLRHKRNTKSALQFEFDREKNLFALLKELQDRTYKISRHSCFVITSPAPREIFAADFRDRIVHHFLCNEIGPSFEGEFIEESFANRKGKGTHKAVSHVRGELQRWKYALKIDIQAFFRSIDRTILFGLVEEKILSLKRDPLWTDDILWLSKSIIFHDPVAQCIRHNDTQRRLLIPPSKSLFYSQGRGLPIGNLTSQFFANVYLNELDHFIRGLGFSHVRYVDDLILFSDDQTALSESVPRINLFLKGNLHLQIHPKKIILQDSRKGIDFLGYIVKPKYILVRRKVVARLNNKLRLGKMNIQMLNSYFGHFLHAQSYRLRRSLCEKLSPFFQFDAKFRKFIHQSPNTVNCINDS